MTHLKKKVYIAKGIINNLVKLSLKSDIEECGIFLGVFERGKIIIIDFVQDKENQFGTSFSTIRQTKNIYKDYKCKIDGEREIDYIGEWHTHPVGNSNPSYIDLKMLEFLLDHPKYGHPTELILGIISKVDGLKLYYKKINNSKLNIISKIFIIENNIKVRF